MNVKIMCNNLHFLNSSQIERWQVAFRQRITGYKSFTFGIIAMTKTILNEIESVEPCPICYCVLHPNTHALPDRCCSQCVGKFHNDCLNVWFRTSNSNSCPLCRQPIQDYPVFNQTQLPRITTISLHFHLPSLQLRQVSHRLLLFLPLLQLY